MFERRFSNPDYSNFHSIIFFGVGLSTRDFGAAAGAWLESRTLALEPPLPPCPPPRPPETLQQTQQLDHFKCTQFSPYVSKVTHIKHSRQKQKKKNKKIWGLRVVFRVWFPNTKRAVEVEDYRTWNFTAMLRIGKVTTSISVQCQI